MGSYADFHRRSIEDRDAFWAEQAKLVDWQTPPKQICDYSNPPFAKWFVGGTTNLCHNAVDRHLKDRPDQNALIFVSTETDDEKPVGAGLSFTADRLTLDYGAAFYSHDRMGHRLTVRWR